MIRSCITSTVMVPGDLQNGVLLATLNVERLVTKVELA